MAGHELRVLHSAALSKPSLGVIRQMCWEQHSAIELGLPWDVALYCIECGNEAESIAHVDSSVLWHFTDNTVRKAVSWIRFLRNYYTWLAEQANNYDVFLLRYNVHDPFQLYFLYKCKKPVFLIHHTLEERELAMRPGFVSFLRTYSEKYIGRLSLRKATGLIGVTKEIVEYEKNRSGLKNIKGYVYPNGIKYKKQPLGYSSTTDLHIIFVATQFSPWHGLDLIINAANELTDRFIIHLVGDVSLADKLAMCSDDRFICHGLRSEAEIEEIAKHCTLGLSSFALSRKGMKEASTLKVREYLALGLPVYAGYKDVFPTDFKYYRQGEADLRKVLKYALEMASESKEQISLAASPYIDKRNLLTELYESIAIGQKK